MFRLLLVSSTALTVVLGYFEASRTCSGCQWIENETQRNNCYGYCGRRGRAIDDSLKYVAGDSCNDCPYEMDQALQGQCWDVCDGGMYGRRGLSSRAAGFRDYTTDNLNCVDGCASITDATAYNKCASACHGNNPYATYQGRTYEEAVVSRDYMTDRFNCVDGCASITDATAYNKCASDCHGNNLYSTYQGRRYEEARQEEVVASRQDCSHCAGQPGVFAMKHCYETCKYGGGRSEVTTSKPFWEQNAILFAIIFAVIASVAGLTYCLYEKKKVKQVNADGRDSVYTSITA